MFYDGDEPINLGGGADVSIAELANLIGQVTSFEGEITMDTSKPDGMPIKVLDSSPLRTLGWKPGTNFKDALLATYEWFEANVFTE